MKMMVSDEAISALTGSGGRTSGVTETMKSVLTLPWGKTSKHTRARLDDSGSMSNVDDEAHPKSIFTCINQSGKAEVTARDRFFVANLDVRESNIKLDSVRSIPSRKASERPLETEEEESIRAFARHFDYMCMLVEAHRAAGHFLPVDMQMGGPLITRVYLAFFKKTPGGTRFQIDVQKFAKIAATVRAISLLLWEDGPFYNLPEYLQLIALDSLLYVDEEAVAFAMCLVSHYTQDPLAPMLMRKIADVIVDSNGLLDNFGINTKHRIDFQIHGSLEMRAKTGLEAYGPDRIKSVFNIIMSSNVKDETGGRSPVIIADDKGKSLSIHKSLLAETPSSPLIMWCHYVVQAHNALLKLTGGKQGLPMATTKTKDGTEHKYLAIQTTAYFQTGIVPPDGVAETDEHCNAYVSCRLRAALNCETTCRGNWFHDPGSMTDDLPDRGHNGYLRLFHLVDVAKKDDGPFALPASAAPDTSICNTAFKHLRVLSDITGSGVPVIFDKSAGDNGPKVRLKDHLRRIHPGETDVTPVGKMFILRSDRSIDKEYDMVKVPTAVLNDGTFVHWPTVEAIAKLPLSIDGVCRQDPVDPQRAVDELCLASTLERPVPVPMTTSAKNPFPRVVFLKPNAREKMKPVAVANAGHIVEKLRKSMARNFGEVFNSDAEKKIIELGDSPAEKIQLERLERHGITAIPEGWTMREILKRHQANRGGLPTNGKDYIDVMAEQAMSFMSAGFQ